MTEIPEHLLKRSRERRAALGLGGGEEAPAAGGGDAPAAATPATTAAAAPPAAPTGPAGRKAAAAAAPPPPPKPDPPYVAAAKSRREDPVLGDGQPEPAADLAVHVRPLGHRAARGRRRPARRRRRGATPAARAATAPAARAASAASSPTARCSKTFPHIEDQLRFVYFGTEALQPRRRQPATATPTARAAPHVTGSLGVMPAQGSTAGGELTDAEILAVVCHERYTLGGADPAGDEYVEEFENWCSEESPIFEALESDSATLADLAEAGIVDAEGERDPDHRRSATRRPKARRPASDRARPSDRRRPPRPRSPPTSSSSAADRPAPRPRTGWPGTATTSRSSRRRRSPARRRAATA